MAFTDGIIRWRLAMPRTKPFDEHADDYEQWFEDNRNAYLSELAALKMALPNPGHGLEVGIGTGRFADPLGIRTGVEPSEKMAKIARSRGLEAVDGVAESLPFKDESFDSVLMVTTICFVDDLARSFREAWRVLKRKGAIVIGFVDAGSKLGREYQRRAKTSRFYAEATFHSYREVLTLLADAGFGPILCWQTIFQPPKELTEPDEVRTGCGEGSFVVIRASKLAQ
jgi:SAM-dependent methyltransferase